MVTRNETITSSTWTEVTLNKASNTSDSNFIKYWVGTVAPDASSKGHMLAPGAGLTVDDFDVGDSFWFKTDKDTAILCVTE